MKEMSAFHNWKAMDNTLLIGDLHAPFTLETYLDFCIEMSETFYCNKVIIGGDIIDNHYGSFHFTNPDGLSAKEELALAKDVISKYYKAFPEADVLLGSHDNIPLRKAFKEGLSNEFVRSISDVLNVPKWNFHNELWLDNNILVLHGGNKLASSIQRDSMCSVIQFHKHTKSEIKYLIGNGIITFSMQLGCGIDNLQYAFRYLQSGIFPQINVGILLNGKIPLISPMPFEKMKA
jgi:hypothetical protein